MASTTASPLSRRLLVLLCLALVCLLGGMAVVPARPSSPAAVRVKAQLAPAPAAPVSVPEHVRQSKPLALVTRKAPSPPPPVQQPEPRLQPPTPPPPPAAIASQPRLPEETYPVAATRALPGEGLVQEMLIHPFPPLMAQSAFIARAEAASSKLQQLLGTRDLQAIFIGTGEAGEMVEIYFQNTSERTVTFSLVAGMILRPPAAQRVQPLLLEDERVFKLGPGESCAARVNSYCMDSQAPAPGPGQEVGYRFSERSRHQRGPEAVRVLQAYRELEGTFCSQLPSELHRYAVIQIAVWKSLNQRVEAGHIRSALRGYGLDRRGQADLMDDVQSVVRQARR